MPHNPYGQNRSLPNAKTIIVRIRARPAVMRIRSAMSLGGRPVMASYP